MLITRIGWAHRWASINAFLNGKSKPSRWRMTVEDVQPHDAGFKSRRAAERLFHLSDRATSDAPDALRVAATAGTGTKLSELGGAKYGV